MWRSSLNNDLRDPMPVLLLSRILLKSDQQWKFSASISKSNRYPNHVN